MNDKAPGRGRRRRFTSRLGCMAGDVAARSRPSGRRRRIGLRYPARARARHGEDRELGQHSRCERLGRDTARLDVVQARVNRRHHELERVRGARREGGDDGWGSSTTSPAWKNLSWSGSGQSSVRYETTAIVAPGAPFESGSSRSKSGRSRRRTRRGFATASARPPRISIGKSASAAASGARATLKDRSGMEASSCLPGGRSCRPIVTAGARPPRPAPAVRP